MKIETLEISYTSKKAGKKPTYIDVLSSTVSKRRGKTTVIDVLSSGKTNPKNKEGYPFVNAIPCELEGFNKKGKNVSNMHMHNLFICTYNCFSYLLNAIAGQKRSKNN